MAMKRVNGYMIHLNQILGKGSYGVVYKGQHQTTKKNCAIKILDKKLINNDEYLKNALLSEIQILQTVKSPNIIAVYDVLESSNNYYIIQQLCDSDLEKYMQKNTKIPENVAIDFLKQICNGFIVLAKEGICHRDLKPANLFICEGVIKIGDFGFAKKNITKKMINASSVGTPLYMSLQILKSQPYTSKCDVWACGFIFYELLHNKTPWIGTSSYNLAINIEKQPMLISEKLSAITKDFLKKSLKIYEKDRMSWDEVFIHPIFNDCFIEYANQNRQFQNKLKSVMSDLRFKINSQNIDLNKLLSLMRFSKESKNQLNFKEFYIFLKSICPKLTKQQANYFFQQVDEDGSGSISIQQIENQMKKHKISFQRQSKENYKLKKSLSIIQQSVQSKLSDELAQKANKCFERLFKVLTYKKLTLFKTFKAYDSHGTDKLSIEQFEKMISRLDNSFNPEEIQLVFNIIDADHSKTIEFQELNSYYCKANGIPQTFDLPEQYIKEKYY